LNFGVVVPSLCEGDIAESFANITKAYPVCFPPNTPDFSFQDFARGTIVTVIANYYTGCNAGRRESGVFAHVAQRMYDLYGDRVSFVQSIKGGGTCSQWAAAYQRDAANLYPDSSSTNSATSSVPTMPLSVNDVNYEIRDDFFTTPFGHPAYVVLDGDLNVRHKFIGPCCGYESYFDCTAEIAKTLDSTLMEYMEAILLESGVALETPVEETGGQEGVDDTGNDAIALDCPELSDFSEFSPCSVTCGATPGIQLRWRTKLSTTEGTGSEFLEGCPALPAPVETRACTPATESCNDEEGACIAEFGEDWSVKTIASGFDSPRDVAFHPTPGFHLGNYSEGRTFFPSMGEEAWVVNGANHSISIVASLGTEHQTTISRRDRGYYHYMINGTALAFNSVSQSNRSPDRDSFNFFSICNDALNTYVDTKEANYFMGPTLYNSSPRNRNLVNRMGDACGEEEPCYFLHSDMLHEAPACIGIAHDPEIATAYGNVYWAFAATAGKQSTGQLVRMDYQQPHGPGSMDHAVASVRRYVEVELERGPPGVHAGMVVHPTRREVYISVPGANKIIVVGADSGSFARSAREEYPIFSNRLPSFEYSIWECVEQKDFATGVSIPTGLALSADGERLFVAERESGKILVFEVSSGAWLYSISTNFKSIGGLSFSPSSNRLYFVDDETNTLNSVEATAECGNPIGSRINPDFSSAVLQAQQALGVSELSLLRDYECSVDPVIPDSAFFDQVHEDTGYADDNPDVQSAMAGMDETAALLANRTDCEPDSDLNFDRLLLGGYFCHVCLPEQELTCDVGGKCSNIQWQGYTCDNEFFVVMVSDDSPSLNTVILESPRGTKVDPASILLRQGVTYRFTVLEGVNEVCILSSDSVADGVGIIVGCATKGPLILTIDEFLPHTVVVLTVKGETVFELAVQKAAPSNNNGVPGGAIGGSKTSLGRRNGSRGGAAGRRGPRRG
jgi:hypothetical protein